MFGYVKTDNPNMYVKDTVLYKAMYCGLCKSISATCGERARLCLNYDLTFLSVFCHNLLNIDVNITKQHCCIHWLKKRDIANVDDLSKRVACLNVILAYHKLNDDGIDENRGGLKRSFFKKGYKKAKKLEPEFDRVVSKYYNELLKLEKEKCVSFDIVADPFGNMMKEIVSIIFNGKTTEDIDTISYSLGKWIYLIDAIDDYDKDILNKSYNVFVLNGQSLSKKEYISKNISELQVIFGAILSDINGACDKLKFNFNHDLIDNILKNGIFKQTKKILGEN